MCSGKPVMVGDGIPRSLKRSKRGTLWTPGALLSVVPVVLLGCLLSISCATGPQPSEEELEARFQKERAAFDSILAMVKEDRETYGFISVDAAGMATRGSHYDPEAGGRVPDPAPLGTERRRKYVQLLGRTGASHCLSWQDSPVLIEVWAWSGGAPAGGSMGYAWVEDEHAVKLLRSWGNYRLHPLKDGWYWYYLNE